MRFTHKSMTECCVSQTGSRMHYEVEMAPGSLANSVSHVTGILSPDAKPAKKLGQVIADPNIKVGEAAESAF